MDDIESGALLGIGLVTGWLGGSLVLEISGLALSEVTGGWFAVPRGMARRAKRTALVASRPANIPSREPF